MSTVMQLYSTAPSAAPLLGKTTHQPKTFQTHPIG